MKRDVDQLVLPGLPASLHERLEALGVTLVTVRADGELVIQGRAPRLARMVASWPVLAHSVRHYLDTLASNPGQAVAVLPGVWLAPMPQRRRRSAGQAAQDIDLSAAMLIGPEFLESEQFRLLCDHQKVDWSATVGHVDPGSLVSAGEARRLAAAITYMHRDLTQLDRRSTDVQTLSTQLGESYEELSLLYKLSTSMAVNQPPLTVLGEACHELQKVVGLRWIAMLLSDDEPGLDELAGEIITAGSIDCDMSVLEDVGRQLLARQADGAELHIVDDSRNLGIAPLTDLARHLLIVSLERDGKTFGILFGGDKLDGSHISSIDSKLCSSLANSMSIFLQNVMLYEDVQAMFMGALHALSSSIDAKDSYTRGHSERVALATRLLAEKAGLDRRTTERAYIAGLLHDVGKIGVPEAVLRKPGRLTSEEFDLIKMHPEIGARILKDIRQMHDLVPGVVGHHERWDGNGYPQKLAGDRIPLLGRLISLADAFDAMSSSRTYRDAMPADRVIAEIKRHAGSQFDPQLAEIFVAMDLEPVRRLMNEDPETDDAQEPPNGLS